MRYSSYRAVEYDLELHYKLLEKYTKAIAPLHSYKGCFIKPTQIRGGKRYYSVKSPGKAGFCYVGGEENEQVRLIREHAFYEKAIHVIQTNIAIMEEFLKIYKRTGAEHINELLGASYTLPHNSPLLRDEAEANEWLMRQQEIKKRSRVFDPDGLKITAFDGTPMRSRAEAFHYEAFYMYNIPVVFELPYLIDGEIYWPDFTFLDVFTMTAMMWEHLGNWFHSNEFKRQKYRQDAIHKFDEYAKIGFYPETNLFLSYGTTENVFDIQTLHRKIAMFASPPPSPETIEMLKKM